MFLRILATVILTLASVSSAEAVWQYTNVSESSAQSRNPQITLDSQNSVHVFWEENPDIMYRYFDGVEWSPVEVLGQGSNIDLATCIPCFDVFVVWVGLDGTPRYRLWRAEQWYDELVVPSGGVGPTRDVAVGKIEDGHVVWAEQDEESQEYHIFYSTIQGAEWTTPLQLGIIHSVADPGHPRIGIRRLEDTGRLIVGWMEDGGETPGIWYREWTGNLWLQAANIYSNVGGGFDLDASPPDVTAHFVANDRNRPCSSCDDVWYAFGEPGNWSEPVAIGTGHFPADSEWPMEVSLHSRWSVNVPNIVWRHESYDADEQLVDERIILAVKQGEEWDFDDRMARNRNAHDPEVYTSSPALATTYVVWSDNSNGQWDIYMATNEASTSVDGDWNPATVGDLRVYPNPTQRGTSIRLNGSTGYVSSVGIYDIAGREVRSLDPAGFSGSSIIEWDGRNRLGRFVPAGTYIVRAVLEGREEVRPVIVIR